MTISRMPKHPTRPSLHLIAATTAALPAVVLSSLALSQPATADSEHRAIPATLAAAMEARATAITATVIPAVSVSTTLPTTFRPTQPSVPADYTIQRGDTISGIAGKYGLDTYAVLKLNSLQANTIIYPGQRIKLTASGQAPDATPAPASTSPARTAGGGSYAVKAGDTLSGIASRHGVKLSDVLSANQLSMSSIIYPGNVLIIPGDSAQPAPATPAANVTPLVPSSFLGFTYPGAVVSSANQNKSLLNASPVPSRGQMRAIVTATAQRMGVEPSLALAFAHQESGFDQRAVSPANAIGTMQVIPSSGQWASDLVGRQINLLDPYDNATAGVAIIRQLIATSDDLDNAIAGYYQGQYSVSKYGMYSDTKNYVASIKAHQKNFS